MTKSQADDVTEAALDDIFFSAVQPKDLDDDEENAAAAEAGEVTAQEKQSLIKTLSKGTRKVTTIQRISLAEKDFTEHNDKKKKTLNFRWYHAVWLFCIAGLIACMLQLFVGPPVGVWMTSSQIAAIGIAPEGCEDGLEYCICPRETVCALNIYSIVLLAIARGSAFFDYPLYMMLFLSKCHNINNVSRSLY